jgi:hypothetical protein
VFVASGAHVTAQMTDGTGLYTPPVCLKAALVVETPESGVSGVGSLNPADWLRRDRNRISIMSEYREHAILAGIRRKRNMARVTFLQDSGFLRDCVRPCNMTYSAPTPYFRGMRDPALFCYALHKSIVDGPETANPSRDGDAKPWISHETARLPKSRES